MGQSQNQKSGRQGGLVLPIEIALRLRYSEDEIDQTT